LIEKVTWDVVHVEASSLVLLPLDVDSLDTTHMSLAVIQKLLNVQGKYCHDVIH
jgi:hypothetical protein